MTAVYSKDYTKIQAMSPDGVPEAFYKHPLEYSIRFIQKREEMQQNIMARKPFEEWTDDVVLQNGVVEHPIFPRQLYTKAIFEGKYHRLLNDHEKLFINICITRITNYPAKILDGTVPTVDVDFDPHWLCQHLDNNRPIIASWIYQLSPNLPRNWGYDTQTATASHVVKAMWRDGLEAVTSPGTPLERTHALNRAFRGNAVFLSHQIMWDFNMMCPQYGLDQYSDDTHVGLGARWWVDALKAANVYNRKTWEKALVKFWPNGPHDELLKSISLRDHCGCACRTYFRYKYDGIPPGRRLKPENLAWA